MSCGHDGCTCGPTTDDPITSLSDLEPNTTEHPDGCCGDHDHSVGGRPCHHHNEEQPA